MSLDANAVRHVAKLAGLAVSPEQVDPLKRELSEILDYVGRLQSVQTRGVVGTSHVHGVVNAFREDIIKSSIPVEEVAKLAPDFTAGGFRVPKII